MYNPSLREEPRHKTAGVIPVQQEASILDWLEKTGRLLARDVQDDRYLVEEEEITDLMGGEDVVYDEDLDSDSDIVDLDE